MSTSAAPFADVRMRGFAHRTPVADFRQRIRRHTAPLPPEPVPLHRAAGRVLHAAVEAACEVPPFDRSAMDGYALRGEETFGASPYNPLAFRVVGEVMPGRALPDAVGPGEAVRIMTGAPLPAGTDAVLMAEYASEADGVMHAQEAVPPGRHVGRAGEDLRRGQPVLAAGRRLRPQDLGVLASIGAATVSCHRQPRVALLITGNELVPPGGHPEGAQIVDTNSVMLAALVQRDGGTVAEVRHVPDEREAIARALRDAPGDLVVTTGGTSVGIEDHAPGLIAEGGRLLVHGVAMRPSAPTGMGLLEGRMVFLLPGNPVSCLAAYDFFVALALRRLAGRAEGWPYARERCRLESRISSQIGRVDYARVVLHADGAARLIATSGASILSSTTQADGFVVVPQDSEGMPAGSEVDVWRYDPPAGDPL